MVLVIFIYNGEHKTFEETNITSKMKEIFKKFSIYTKVSLESIIFLYNGQKINEDLELKDLISNINKNEIKILVNDKNNNELNSDFNVILSKYPICRECGGIIRINIKDYKINLFECDKGHENKGLTFEEYIEIQKVDETKIICNNCKKVNKTNTYKKQFYKCFSCKMNLCPLCESQHDQSHGIALYDEKDFNCQIHNYSFNSYCNNCKTNICIECEDEHKSHDINSLGKFFPNKNNLKNYYKELKDKIDKFNEFINEILNKINKVAKIINIYYNIISNHIDIYKNKKTSYQIFQNINDFQKNKIILNDITEIINESDIKNKIDYIFKIYNKIKDIKENNIQNMNTNNIIKENEIQEEQNKIKQLNENNELKYLELKNKYEELNKKYEKLFNESHRAIEEKNKLSEDLKKQLAESNKNLKLKEDEKNKIENLNKKLKLLIEKNETFSQELIKKKDIENNLKDLEKKYQQLNNEKQKAIEEKDKLNQELEEVKRQYQIIKNDFNKINSEKSKYMGEKNNFDKLKKELEKYKEEKRKIDEINIKYKEEKKNIELEKKKFEQLYNEFLNKFQNEKNQHDNLKKAYENQKKQIEENNKKDKDEYKKKYNELINKQNLYIHIGIECKKCFMMPIIGYRYKCSKCKNYDLCEICEEKNEISEEHPHYFIKIRNKYKEGNELSKDDLISNKNLNNNIININNFKYDIYDNNDSNKEKETKKVYSYDCLNKEKLSYYVYEGTDEAKIEIILKNNGKEAWPKDCTKLIFGRPSAIEGEEILLEPQKPGEQKNYYTIFKNVSNLPVGEHTSYLSFCVNDVQFGENLELIIGVKKIKKKSEIEQNIDKINDFRKTYQLEKNDGFSNEQIFEALKKNNFDYYEAFGSLFP